MKKERRKPRKATRAHNRAVEAVSQQSKFLETVLESLTHPFYVIDAEDYTIKMANSAARLGRITGTTTCYALTHRKNKPCGTEAHPCPLEIVKKTKEPVTVEHIHYDKDGRARNVEVHGFPIFDERGNVVQMIEYCLDITDRKRVEKALQFEKDKLTNILDSMEDGVYIASDQYEIEYINPALTKEFGPANKRKCYDYFYNRRDICPWCKSRDVFKGAVVRWEWRCPMNNKTYDLLDTPIRNPDGSLSKLEIFRDITERKRMEEALRESERRYRSFVQNFQGIVFQGHLDFVPVFFHGAVEEITGYREDEFTAGKPKWDQIIHPDDLTAISRTAEQVRTIPGYATEREYRIVRRDGHVRWVHELIQNICDDSGKPSLVQGALHDVTERKRMEEDLRKYREHLEELVQARTTELTETNRQLREEIERRKGLERELLSVVERERQRIGQELHDSLGQQLTGIAFMMEVLAEKLADRSPAEEATYAEKINAQVGRAVGLARNLAKGFHPVDLDRNGLLPVLEELAADTEQLFNVSCTVTCDQAVSLSPISAPINLYRIVQEAITNAVKHGKARNIRVRLSVQDGSVVLSVENDGLAFPSEPGRPEGMGLKIMRYRAELINSTLDIRTGAHGGTVVRCVVPKQEVP